MRFKGPLVWFALSSIMAGVVIGISVSAGFTVGVAFGSGLIGFNAGAATIIVLNDSLGEWS